MELELKHLAPYLPYGLRVKNGEDIFIINAMSLECVFFKDGLLNIFDAKPILLPLSSLTKADWSLYMSLYGLTKTEILEKPIEYLPYGLINSWFENHIDIFGLIEAGLAIDINTL